MLQYQLPDGFLELLLQDIDLAVDLFDFRMLLGIVLEQGVALRDDLPIGFTKYLKSMHV